MNVRQAISIGAGRIVHKGMHLLGRTSTALPGYVAERIDKDTLYEVLQKRTYKHRIIVTGTNGKTTTTLLMKNVLQAAGLGVVNNSSGSNLSRGILTTLLQDKCQGSEVALLMEVDEASMLAVVPALQPTHMIVTNLFRDQLDRYGEVTTTQDMIARALAKAPDAHLILNADDPWVAMLGAGRKHHGVSYFGMDIDHDIALDHDYAADLPVSNTGSGFEYTRRYFGHLGQYSAADKSFQRPRPDASVVASSRTKDGREIIDILMYKKHHKIKTNLLGIYNQYNINAVIITSKILGVDINTTVNAVEATKPGFGRQESVEHHGTIYDFRLIKNPTGFNQVIQEFCRDQHDKRPLVFVINDNFADGRDVSWLWDVAIEDIRTAGVCIASGKRAHDMALRLQYAGMTCVVKEEISEALDYAAKQSPDNHVRVLPTYTALLSIRKQFDLKLEHEQ